MTATDTPISRSQAFREAAQFLRDLHLEDPLGKNFYTGLGLDHGANALEEHAAVLAGGGP
ncbi:hypothetical protein [Streptomyces vinaceus]|uniref:hypothetical protein n=1 Tax=Streptomyces vinaceus TaxID=1960 RepID=UPI0036997C0C